ncbi:MAG: hypothetical protein R2568_10600 [Candidatus Scalindua sp.]|nr:hypothetical protein [Candidatus Scalindua sp.]
MTLCRPVQSEFRTGPLTDWPVGSTLTTTQPFTAPTTLCRLIASAFSNVNVDESRGVFEPKIFAVPVLFPNEILPLTRAPRWKFIVSSPAPRSISPVITELEKRFRVSAPASPLIAYAFSPVAVIMPLLLIVCVVSVLLFTQIPMILLPDGPETLIVPLLVVLVLVLVAPRSSSIPKLPTDPPVAVMVPLFMVMQLLVPLVIPKA